MCGIFGFYSSTELGTLSKDNMLTMSESIKHRGPDGEGFFISENNRVGLGNNRLAIIDVEHGQQPFFSSDRSVVVVQNGEVFNYIELMAELKSVGVVFESGSDTEVILRLYEFGGLKALEQLNGMFSIAIYDQRVDSLYLIRDRVGEKPLFWCEHNGCVVFASEIKAILEVTGPLEISSEAIDAYLTYNYVPSPLTMFRSIKHVEPGHRITFKGKTISDECWWDLSKISTIQQSEEQWVEQFSSLLDDAVRIRLRSDVDFGAFLSGGVDSSTVVGMMSRHLSQPVKSFNIGFSDPLYDESPYALEAAERFGCQHYSEVVEPNLFSQWADAIYYCDQPHGDASFLPTKKVSEIASRHVKMVLTGDGADELYAGYDKYKSFFDGLSLSVSEDEFRTLYCEKSSLFSRSVKKALYSKEFKIALGGVNAHEAHMIPLFEKVTHMDRVNQVLFVDVCLLLSGNNLVKPDRMGMAHSIENRAPFLDFRVIEQAFRMPGVLKLNNGVTKYIYKKAVAELIGEKLAYRKKQMFTVPIGEWFKTTLRDMCHDLLLSEQAHSRKLFDYDFVENMLGEHCSGKSNYTREIRALMALEIWFRRFDRFIL